MWAGGVDLLDNGEPGEKRVDFGRPATAMPPIEFRPGDGGPALAKGLLRRCDMAGLSRAAWADYVVVCVKFSKWKPTWS